MMFSLPKLHSHRVCDMLNTSTIRLESKLNTRVLVRPAKPNDVEYILKAQREMVGDGSLTHESLTGDRIRSLLAGETMQLVSGTSINTVSAKFFVGMAGPIPVGFVGAYGYHRDGVVELHYAFVGKHFRGKGLGGHICMETIRALSSETERTVFAIRAIDKTDATKRGGAKLALALGMKLIDTSWSAGVHSASYSMSVKLDRRLG